MGQTFAFRRLNKRRLLNAEADQTVRSAQCQKWPFGEDPLSAFSVNENVVQKLVPAFPRSESRVCLDCIAS